MGQLRLEPKNKPLMERARYDDYLHILKDAHQAANENTIYWDLDTDEDSTRIRKEFLYVLTCLYASI